MTVLHSPSMLGLAKLCMARAVAAYGPDRIRDPESASMREGTRLHRVVQDYLRDGVVPPNTEVAAHRSIAATKLNPASIEPHNIERVVLLPGFFGYIDFEPGQGHIGDLKFTKNARYQRATDPTQDPQRIIYAADSCYRYGVKEVKLQWVVSQFDGKSAVSIEHTFTARETKKLMRERVLPLANRLGELLESGTQWNTLTGENKNLSACNMYPPNGCACAAVCRKPTTFLKPKE